MSAIKDLTIKSKISYLQVGKGRLASAVIRHILREPKLSGLLINNRISTTRIDKRIGLVIAEADARPIYIDRLLICIAPGSSKQWRWDEIFAGLKKQVNRNEIFINELIFISSTRVYDGIPCGLVSASVVPRPSSDRAKNLLVAEQLLNGLARNYCVLRCCGLVGQGYQLYQQILSQPDKQARFAVDIDQVAKRVIERLLSENRPYQQSIVTDGFCYYAGKQLTFEQSLELADGQRILKNSDSVTDN